MSAPLSSGSLSNNGEKVRVFVLPEEDISSLNGLPLEVAKGNVLDRESVRKAMEGIQTVYHLAGIISIMPGRNEKMRQVNVVGTSNVARLARELGVRRMVYVSSIHALGRPAKGTPIDEKVPFDPHNLAGEYDQTKAEASLAVLAEVAKGLDAVLICPTGIIGPYHYRGGSPMSDQMRKWMKPGWHVVLNGHFDFVDVRDVARGMILAGRNGTRGGTYIIRGQRVSVTELLALVRESHRSPWPQHPGAVPTRAPCSLVRHASFPSLAQNGAAHTVRAGNPGKQLGDIGGEGACGAGLRAPSDTGHGARHRAVAGGEP